MAVAATAGVNELTRLLAADPEVRRRFRTSVAVSVSGLFRDPAQFELLEENLAEARRGTFDGVAVAPGGVLLLGRSERLTRPEALGHESVAPHAYRKVA